MDLYRIISAMIKDNELHGLVRMSERSSKLVVVDDNFRGTEDLFLARNLMETLLLYFTFEEYWDKHIF